MPWITKAKLRIELAVEQTKNAALQREVERLEVYIAKCENLIDHERQRVTDERERADRVNDALLQQNGLPASTATVRAEQAEKQAELEDAFEKQRKEYEEIYSETVEEIIGDSDLSVAQEVQDIVSSAVQ